MLIRSFKRQYRKSRQRGRRLWHNADANIPSMGCSVCPEYQTCGGLIVSQPLFWCLDNCCRNPQKCDSVCRNNPHFVDRIREIGGLGFSGIPKAAGCNVPNLPVTVPMLFHGSGRKNASKANWVVLPFAKTFDRRTGAAKFQSREALCATFKIDPLTSIVLSGTDTDPPIEAWWKLGRDKRRSTIRQLRDLGVNLITSPNYSLFTDQPRWDDLHSMKRIALTHNEMISEGLQAAIHINGRTDRDFERWTEYISAHSEIQFLAYEFTTGPGWVGRREKHLAWLTKVAVEVGRPLHLIVRGGVELLPELAAVFANVTFVDTAAFMRTMKRRRAIVTESGRLSWRASPTAYGEPLDDLLTANVATVTTWILNHLDSNAPILKMSA